MESSTLVDSSWRPESRDPRMPQRQDHREPLTCRPINLRSGIQKNAAGSVLIEWGDTHVICAASIEDRVPYHRVERGEGWLTAEYSMLPASTHRRTRRERPNVSGRSAEIQRLIGRSLRTAFNLKRFKGHTLWIDCDVLQADGGTRCASITGAYVAACIAVRKTKHGDQVDLRTPVSAVSVGIVDGEILVDLAYAEDSNADVDLNVVCSPAGIIEVQGTAEGRPFSRSQLDQMVDAAASNCEELFSLQKAAIDAAVKVSG